MYGNILIFCFLPPLPQVIWVHGLLGNRPMQMDAQNQQRVKHLKDAIMLQLAAVDNSISISNCPRLVCALENKILHDEEIITEKWTNKQVYVWMAMNGGGICGTKALKSNNGGLRSTNSISSDALLTNGAINVNGTNIDDDDDDSDDDDDDDIDGEVVASDASSLASIIVSQFDISHETADRFIASQNPAIRIFLSSTFTDTQTEKNAFMRHVYPQIHQRCLASGLGLTFETIDMRFGVTKEAGNDHRTWELCRREVDECSKRSMGLYFVCLYADKYGYRPLPRLIPLQHWNELWPHIPENIQKILQVWYARDSSYCDYDRMTLLTLETKAQEDEYWEKYVQVREALNAAAIKLKWPLKKRLEFTASVTEQEIRYCTEHRDEGSRAVWLKRRITDKSAFTSEKMISDFFAKPEEQPFLKDLEKSVHGKFKRVLEWKVSSSDLVKTDNTEYIKSVCDKMQGILNEAVDSALMVLKQSNHLLHNGEQSQGFIRELLHHVAIAIDRGSHYIPVPSHGALLQRIKDHIFQGSGSLLLLGYSGNGKTSVLGAASMAFMKSVASYDYNMGTSTIFLVRFLGTSRDSTDIGACLASLYRQMMFVADSGGEVAEERINTAMEWKQPEKFSQLLDQVCDEIQLIKMTRADTRVVIVLDSLDQLSVRDGGWKQLRWVQRLADAGAVLLMSALTDEDQNGVHCYDYNIVDRLHQAKVQFRVEKLTSLKEHDAREFMVEYLKRKGRKVTSDEHEELLLKKIQGHGLLHCHLVLDVVAHTWTSYHHEMVVGGNSIHDIITAEFQRLKHNRGEEVVATVMGLLAASRIGLSSREICDVLSCDVYLLRDRGPVFEFHIPTFRMFPSAIWQRIVRDIEAYITGLGVQRFYHRQHQEAAEKLFLSDVNARVKAHKALASYFAGKEWRETRGNLGISEDVLQAIDPQPWVQNTDGYLGNVIVHHGHMGKETAVINHRKAMELLYHVLRSIRDGGDDDGGDFAGPLLSMEYIECRARCLDVPEMLLEFQRWNEIINNNNSSNIKARVSDVTRFLRKFSSQLQHNPITTLGLAAATPAFKSLSHSSNWYPSSSSPFSVFSGGFPRISRVFGGSGLQIWDENICVLNGHKKTVTFACWSPDEAMIASSSKDSTVRVWDSLSGSEIAVMQHGNFGINCVCWHSNGLQLFCGGTDGNIHVWDVSSVTEGESLKGHTKSVNHVALCKANGQLLSASFDGSIKIWDISSGSCISELKTEGGAVMAAWSHDGKFIASVPFQGPISAFDVSSGEKLYDLSDDHNKFYCVQYSPDGQLLASGANDCKIRLWNVENGQQVGILEGHPYYVTGIVWCNDGKHLTSASQDTTLKIWNVERCEVVKTLTGHMDGVSCVQYNGDNTKLLTGSDDTCLRLWDAPAIAATTANNNNGMEHTVWISTVHWHPTIPDQILSSSYDASMIKWDASTGNAVSQHASEHKWVLSAVISRNGQHVASISGNNEVDILDYGSMTLVGKLQGHEGEVYCVNYSPDGCSMVTASYDKTVRIWDAADFTEKRRFSGHTERVNSAAFCASGQLVASGSKDRTVRVWPVDGVEDAGEIIFQGHTDAVLCVRWCCLDASHCYLASSAKDTTVRIWDAHHSGSPKFVLNGHSDAVGALDWCHELQILASGSNDNTIRLWKILDDSTDKTVCCVATLHSHTDRVSCVAWSLDAKRLASSSKDKTIAIWQVG